MHLLVNLRTFIYVGQYQVGYASTYGKRGRAGCGLLKKKA